MTQEPSREFSKIAEEYDKGRAGENVKFWIKETQRLAELNTTSLLLDLGCGTGIYTLGIAAEISSDICGIDPVSDMLRKAKSKSSKINWLKAVGEYLPFKSKIIDAFFSSQVWHHIEDKQRVANECHRVLKSKGRLVIRTISHSQLKNKIIFHYFPEILVNQLRVYPSCDDFNQYFKRAGFTSTEYHEYTLKRYQSPEELIEIAEKKLWSMFRSITKKGLDEGKRKLHKYMKEYPGKPIRNDEMITLVVTRK